MITHRRVLFKAKEFLHLSKFNLKNLKSKTTFGVFLLYSVKYKWLLSQVLPDYSS